MGDFRVTKRFSFDSAHVLAKGYVGKCSNIHGHTWTVEITVVAPEQMLNQHDMIVDFSLLKQVGSSVKDRFDHKLILCKDDEDTKQMLASATKQYAVVYLDKNPTVEVLCKEISQMAWAILASERAIHNIIVTIWETPDSKCSYG